MSTDSSRPHDPRPRRSAEAGGRRVLVAVVIGAGLISGGFLLARERLFTNRLAVPAGELVTSRMWEPPENGLTVLFHERLPYYHKENGDVTGLCVRPVRRALARAGLTVRWVEMPPPRQLDLLRQNTPRVAALGWFRLPERERFAKYSAPVYRDRPLVALTFVDEARFPAGRRAAELLPSLPLRLLVRRGYSYGVWMDELIARAKLPPEETDLDNRKMIRLLRAGRADFFVVAEEEAQDLLADAGKGGVGLRMVRFTDAPPGPFRHLLFSRATPDELIRRVDAGLAAERGRPGSTLTVEAP